MKFGVRECANITFKAKSTINVAGHTFHEGQPVLYIDTAKTSTLEGASTTVYATGGRGNTRLVAWEGEKTLTFTVEDALLSPISFAMLSGAGLFGKADSSAKAYFHTTTQTTMATATTVTIPMGDGEVVYNKNIYVAITDKNGDITGVGVYAGTAATEDGVATITITVPEGAAYTPKEGDFVLVDYYIEGASTDATELQIDAEHFAGSYYVEADTLFRRQSDNVDLPAMITLPNVKIQSNFTFTMASTGDPSTFTFTMDAFPGYTYFDNTKKVLCVMQIMNDAKVSGAGNDSVMDIVG